MKTLAAAAIDSAKVFGFTLDLHISVLPISAAVDVDATSGIIIASLLASIEL